MLNEVSQNKTATYVDYVGVIKTFEVTANIWLTEKLLNTFPDVHQFLNSTWVVIALVWFWNPLL